MSEVIGELERVDGEKENVTGLFKIFKDEREVCILETDSGFVVQTESWLRQNNRELVRHTAAYTPETFALMMEAMVLASKYFGFNLDEQIRRIHADDGDRVRFEYGGHGEPNFQDELNGEEGNK